LIHAIDSHTGGEPTRVIISGGPKLPPGTVAEKARLLAEKHDDFRKAVILEPRGSDVLVGALLVESADPICTTGVIFFDNVKFIGMCGHGTIGVAETLAFLGRIEVGQHRLETPVGIVDFERRPDRSVVLTNVPSYRLQTQVSIQLDDGRRLSGDVAWGGNWFFITEEHGQSLIQANVEPLTELAWKIRLAVNQQGYPEVDHIVLQTVAATSDRRSRNFVLCPGKAYDRSPCGTGTSAWLACLASDGRLQEGQTWIQESIIGSTFEASYTRIDRERPAILPCIRGQAFITGCTTLLQEPGDPFHNGIRK
jgi:4-hydroxyproline epimerase